MRYAYYANLKPRQKAVYRRSDETVKLSLPNRPELARLAAAIGKALEAQDRARVERASRALAEGIATAFEVPPVRVKSCRGARARARASFTASTKCATRVRRRVIRVWMRTAQHKRVVAFRTFLRTLLHELCHHLDYELLKLEDSFHTEGFFKRESSLFKQLVT